MNLLSDTEFEKCSIAGHFRGRATKGQHENLSMKKEKQNLF